MKNHHFMYHANIICQVLRMWSVLKFRNKLNSNKHHNFSRIAPSSKYFSKWNKFQPLVKAKWYWDEVNRDLLKSSKRINKQNYKIFKIEEFEYESYLEICKWLKVKPVLSKIQFSLLNNFQRLKNIKIRKRNLNLLKKFQSRTEKQFYPENLNKK